MLIKLKQITHRTGQNEFPEETSEAVFLEAEDNELMSHVGLCLRVLEVLLRTILFTT